MYDFKCESCNNAVSSEVNTCPSCGTNVEKQKRRLSMLFAIQEENRRLKSKKEIIKLLIKRGWPEEEVIECFASLEVADKALMADPAGRKQIRQLQIRNSLGLLKYGLPFLLGGVIASVVLKEIGIIWVGAFVVGVPLTLIGVVGFIWFTLMKTIGR